LTRNGIELIQYFNALTLKMEMNCDEKIDPPRIKEKPNARLL
jgi:hypothetical protein